LGYVPWAIIVFSAQYPIVDHLSAVAERALHIDFGPFRDDTGAERREVGFVLVSDKSALHSGAEHSLPLECAWAALRGMDEFHSWLYLADPLSTDWLRLHSDSVESVEPSHLHLNHGDTNAPGHHLPSQDPGSDDEEEFDQEAEEDDDDDDDDDDDAHWEDEDEEDQVKVADTASRTSRTKTPQLTSGAETTQQNGFWEMRTGRITRWLLFIPIGLGLSYVLRLIVVSLFLWAFPVGSNPWEVGLTVFFLLAPLAPLLLMLAWGAAILPCHIPPNRRLAVPIFGTLLVIDYLGTILMQFERSGRLFAIGLAVCILLGTTQLLGVLYAWESAPDPR